ncbi:NAD(P)/FAD-dependent oxidoreductase [Gulosibacter chungangensis]|uniref:NAD(P)/FAD-dependent oxidoreductase n=1 Tax=Gulosibacter chungangensis TaxID=979746 RepID=A0A7J5BB48_9MICO|nr:FAD-dependent oxidoreductase [Gulosibacter chungangensis]KAB1643254.1 NAD(P)/FAD-dependent oxidoreductase [Gulosibacter chungangensis]
MTKILIVGGGYAGFTTARQLEKQLNPGEAQVTLVDPLPYMTYQPFLPEVIGGSIEARHAVVSHRRHLKRTRVITAEVTKIDHASKTATLKPKDADEYTLGYDIVVVTAGAVSRTFPIAGVADNAIGVKRIEEAIWVRDKIIDNFNRASTMAPGPERSRLLTFVVVGGGFAGIEAFAEMRSLATALLADYPSLQFDDVQFHLIEAAGRIMPEVSEETALWVIKNLAERGATVHLNTQCSSAVDGNVETSAGDVFPTDVLVWTAGQMANPFVKGFTDLPVNERGNLRTRADLRVEGDEGVVKDAWGAGDVAAVPDLSGGGVAGFCVPNAQHAVRQAAVLAENIVATLRGDTPTDYYHENIGAVAGLGMGVGAFQSGNTGITGFPAWAMHRGYHGMAIPTIERKVRVFGGWAGQLVLGRDFVSLPEIAEPKAFFERYAARPRPAADEKKADAAKPAAKPAAPAAK